MKLRMYQVLTFQLFLALGLIFGAGDASVAINGVGETNLTPLWAGIVTGVVGGLVAGVWWEFQYWVFPESMAVGTKE